MRSLSIHSLTAVAISIILLGQAPVKVYAKDGECTKDPCGHVYNESPWPMKWGYWYDGDDYKTCDVYNWHGEDEYDYEEDEKKGVYCEYEDIKPYYDVGGYEYDKKDVDAFCYWDRKYWVHWEDYDDAEYYLDAKVWTKFPKDYNVTCYDEKDVAHCYLVENEKDDDY